MFEITASVLSEIRSEIYFVKAFILQMIFADDYILNILCNIFDAVFVIKMFLIMLN